jgi:uncharacterized protein YecT (DUF1311 family)
MRRTPLLIVAGLLVVAVGLLIAGHFVGFGNRQLPAALAVSAPTPPPNISEAFTLLPCNRNTTIGLEGCAEHQVAALDARIDVAQRHLFGVLRSSANQVQFELAASDWNNYRSSTCLSTADAYTGGSIEPVAYANCLVLIDRQRLAQLARELSNYVNP